LKELGEKSNQLLGESGVSRQRRVERAVFYFRMLTYEKELYKIRMVLVG
jgi:hypothetical protein